MQSTPKGNRLQIGIFGRRNVGKSSLLNALTRQNVAIVSEFAGTTTDPVEKPMEMLPLGPVLFIDTAGIDDVGSIGVLRIEKTQRVFDRVDIGILVCEACTWSVYEEQLLTELSGRKISTLIVFNKIDQCQLNPATIASLQQRGFTVIRTQANSGEGIAELRSALLKNAPDDFINHPSILGDLIPPGELVVLVVPIDMEAPKGRLILPQVQSIRDILDHDAYCMVVKERELKDALERLRRPPALVVTDSQAFLKVTADTPSSVLLTSFSILFARHKGDLNEYVRGALAIDHLKTGDRVLIAEACTHHPIGDDIGRVKIPRWVTQYVGGQIEFDHIQGHDFPEQIHHYKLVIHCGACMLNRRETLARIMKCRNAGVPVTNYGLTIAWSLGIFERALQPFPAALELFHQLNR